MLTFAKITFFCAEGLFTKGIKCTLKPWYKAATVFHPTLFTWMCQFFTPIYLPDLNTFMCLAIVSDVLGLAYKLKKPKKDG